MVDVFRLEAFRSNSAGALEDDDDFLPGSAGLTGSKLGLCALYVRSRGDEPSLKPSGGRGGRMSSPMSRPSRPAKGRSSRPGALPEDEESEDEAVIVVGEEDDEAEEKAKALELDATAEADNCNDDAADMDDDSDFGAVSEAVDDFVPSFVEGALVVEDA